MNRPVPPGSDVTVIITTRNRAGQLTEVLELVANQETQGAFTFDILVVDNGSTDDTPEVIADRRRVLSTPIRNVYEARVGRPYALNTGMLYATGNIFGFTDDDTLPTRTWLRALWTCLHEEDADAVTGRVLPHWMAPRPPWLTDEAFQAIGRLGCQDYGPVRLRSSERKNCRWLTSNMMIRRRAVERLGVWDVRLRYLQDTEYYRRAVDAGLRVVYEPAAVVSHKIGPERLTARYFRRRRRHAGAYWVRDIPWSRRHLVTIMPLRRYRRTLGLVRDWVHSSLRGAPWWQRFHRELLLREDLSVWWYRLRLWPRWWLTELTGRSFMP
jgi:GT2 family glycosyltransferase